MIACAPGIVPYLISKRYGWRKCLRLAVIFNLPRIIILTLLGILVGILAFSLAKEIMDSTVTSVFAGVQAFGYGLLGIFILIFGGYMFVTSIETREDLKEGKPTGKCQAKHKPGKKVKKISKTCARSRLRSQSPPTCDPPDSTPRQGRLIGFIQKRFRSLQGNPRNLFFIWGGILSIACLGEIIMVELSFFSGTLGVMSDSMLNAALLGGAGMFLFALGAAIPIIIVAVLSSSISKYFKTIERLETIRTIGAIAMIMVGLVMILSVLSGLISSL